MPIEPRRIYAIAASLSLFACSQSLDPAAGTTSALSPDAAPKPVIDSLSGDVTAHEVSAFLAAAAAASIPTSQFPNGKHNYLADGDGGTALEGINRMVEVARAIPALAAQSEKILDVAIAWSDAWLAHRNDLPLGEHRVMWTGNVDPIWPPDALPSTYAACEVGETVGILAYTALNIVKAPSLANKTVPDGDPQHFGATYGARAKTYVAMLEHTMDAYFNQYFLDASTLTIHHPNSAAYNALGSNNVNAWNREMMFLHAWQTLAEVHTALGDDPARATKYAQITRNTVDLFVQNTQERTAPDGTPVYDWGYGNFGDEKKHLTGEQIGIHAQYDIWGLTRAYRAGYTSATAQQMKRYADTVAHELTLSPGVYASNIDRCCGGSPYHYLPAGFLYLTPYNTAIFAPAAQADIASGAQGSHLGITADILWAKHWIAAHSQPQQGTACSPSIASYTLGTCKATVEYGGKLYACASQTAGVNGEPSGCGSAGVYCSSVPPDDAAWGSVAWTLVGSCP